jgi:hypothetical protein
VVVLKARADDEAKQFVASVDLKGNNEQENSSETKSQAILGEYK